MNVNGSRRDPPLPGIVDDAVADLTVSLDARVFQRFGQVRGCSSGEGDGKQLVRTVRASADEREAQGASRLTSATDATAKAGDYRVGCAHVAAGLRPTLKASGQMISRLWCLSPHTVSRLLSSATTGSAPCSATYRPV